MNTEQMLHVVRYWDERKFECKKKHDKFSHWGKVNHLAPNFDDYDYRESTIPGNLFVTFGDNGKILRVDSAKVIDTPTIKYTRVR